MDMNQTPSGAFGTGPRIPIGARTARVRPDVTLDVFSRNTELVCVLPFDLPNIGSRAEVPDFPRLGFS